MNAQPVDEDDAREAALDRRRFNHRNGFLGVSMLPPLALVSVAHATLLTTWADRQVFSYDDLTDSPPSGGSAVV